MNSHLAELRALLAPSVGSGAGVPARDSCISIENACRNALDDELVGFASQLFDRSEGLPSLLVRSLEIGARRNDPPIQELRLEVLKLIEHLITDACARERDTQIAEYACDVVRACLHVFRIDDQSKTRDEAITTLLAAINLRDAVPDVSELRAALFPPQGPGEDAERDGVRSSVAIDLFWKALVVETKSSKGSSETVRGGCMRVLGQLALLFPVAVCDEPIYEKGQLFRRCENALKSGVGLPEITGALEGLDGLLWQSQLTPAQVRTVFHFTLQRLSLSKEGGKAESESNDIKRFGAPKAALQLLGRNLALFAAQPDTPLALESLGEVASAESGGGSAGEARRLGKSFLITHGKELWEAVIPLWTHSNAPMHALADEVLRGLVGTMGRQLVQVECLVKQGDLSQETSLHQQCHRLYRLIHNSLRALLLVTSTLAIDSSSSSSATLPDTDDTPIGKALASGADRSPPLAFGLVINVFAMLAPPIASLSGPAVVMSQLTSLSEFCSSFIQPEASRYYGGRQRMDRSPRQLPPFLLAHALMLQVVPDAPTRSVDASAALLLRCKYTYSCKS